jgi:hypothetical protein
MSFEKIVSLPSSVFLTCKKKKKNKKKPELEESCVFTT